jgi:hypothetical protein
MVVVVVLLAVVDTDVPELGSLSIAVLWSLNLVENTNYQYQEKPLTTYEL